MLNNDRIIYKRNQLVEVICQVNYPSILSIETTEPSEFQTLIRTSYPKYQFGNEYEDEIAINLKNNNIESKVQRHTISKLHCFISQDDSCRVVVAKNRISYSMKKYDNWEKFYDNFWKVFKEFNEIYQPNYFNRIGIRYINLINKKRLQLDAKWEELLKPQILGFNNSNEEDYEIVNTTVKSEILYNGMNARITSSYVLENETNEKCYLIDCDYYKVSDCTIDRIDDNLKKLHDNFQGFFDDLITEKMRNSLNCEGG